MSAGVRNRSASRERPEPLATVADVSATDAATAVAARARALLEAVEAGEAVGAHVEALCAAVLEAPAVKLALAVREGGPFRVRRALDLAELVLTGEARAHEREALPA